MSDVILTRAQIAAAELTDWQPIQGALYTRLRTGNFATGLRLVDVIGEAAELLSLNLPPDAAALRVQDRGHQMKRQNPGGGLGMGLI